MTETNGTGTLNYQAKKQSEIFNFAHSHGINNFGF